MIRLLLLLAVISVASAATAPGKLTLAITDRPAVELMDLLAKHCQCGLYAEPSALPALADNVSIAFAQVPWDTAVDQIASGLHLDLMIKDGFLCVAATDAKRPSRLYEMRIYDLRVPTSSMRDHPGIDLGVPTERVLVSRLLPPIEPETKPEINEFIEIIQKMVEPASWMLEGIAIEEWNGNMVVTHTPAAHQQVVQVLTRIEALNARQILCRVYRLGKIPADTGAVLNAQQWVALSERLAPPAAVFIARNDQTQNHFSGVQRLLVVDADQNQFVHAPIVDVLSTGLSLTVHPTATVAGVMVETKLWATVDSSLPTSVVRDVANQPLVSITTPHVTTDHSSDLRTIPSGGAAIYRFGDRAYALTTDVIEPAQIEAVAKP